MESIYSRKKVKLPKKYVNIITIIVVALLTVFFLIKTITPVFNNLCQSEAKATATKIVNDTIDDVMENYTYTDLVVINKDNDGKINSIHADTATLNKIVSNIATNIQKNIDSQENRDIYIRLGTFTGITLLSGRGPKVPIRISSIGNIDTNIKSEFESAGINQTIHRITLETKCEIQILTPFNTIVSSVEDKVILAENIVIGEIPESYFDIGNLLENEKKIKKIQKNPQKSIKTCYNVGEVLL